MNNEQRIIIQKLVEEFPTIIARSPLSRQSKELRDWVQHSKKILNQNEKRTTGISFRNFELLKNLINPNR